MTVHVFVGDKPLLFLHMNHVIKANKHRVNFVAQQKLLQLFVQN